MKLLCTGVFLGKCFILLSCWMGEILKRGNCFLERMSHLELELQPGIGFLRPSIINHRSVF